MKYYLHDSNSFSDEKITELFMEYGYEGLGLFYSLLEKLASQEKPIKTEVLKSQLKVGKKLTRCWNAMETIGLIHSNNGETFSMRMMDYCETYKKKNQESAKRTSEWRKNQKDTKNDTHYESIRNAPKEKESKTIEYNLKEREPPPKPQRFYLEIEEIEEYLKSEQEWKDVISLQNGITSEEVNKSITQFITVLKGRGESGKTPKDSKEHFYNWLKNQNNGNKGKHTTAYNNRNCPPSEEEFLTAIANGIANASAGRN